MESCHPCWNWRYIERGSVSAVLCFPPHWITSGIVRFCSVCVCVCVLGGKGGGLWWKTLQHCNFFNEFYLLRCAAVQQNLRRKLTNTCPCLNFTWNVTIVRFFPVERHDSTEENLISVTFLSADLANLVLFFLAREVFASEHRICSRNVASILERVNKKTKTEDKSFPPRTNLVYC